MENVCKTYSFIFADSTELGAPNCDGEETKEDSLESRADGEHGGGEGGRGGIGRTKRRNQAVLTGC